MKAIFRKLAAIACLTSNLSLLASTIDFSHATKVQESDWVVRPKPDYPRAEQASHHMGTVRIGFVVASEGRLQNLTIISSSGFAGIDNAALTSLEKARVAPRLAGKTCATPMTFSMWGSQR